jgi:hypothetical protein
MAANQNKISSFKSVIQMGLQFAILAGLNMVLSGDLGVTLIFLFVFIGMAFTGGVSYLWFIAAGGGVVAIAPIFWNYFLDNYQKIRIQILFDPSIDPTGTDARYRVVLRKDTPLRHRRTEINERNDRKYHYGHHIRNQFLPCIHNHQSFRNCLQRYDNSKKIRTFVVEIKLFL